MKLLPLLLLSLVFNVLRAQGEDEGYLYYGNKAHFEASDNMLEIDTVRNTVTTYNYYYSSLQLGFSKTASDEQRKQLLKNGDWSVEGWMKDYQMLYPDADSVPMHSYVFITTYRLSADTFAFDNERVEHKLPAGKHFDKLTDPVNTNRVVDDTATFLCLRAGTDTFALHRIPADYLSPKTFTTDIDGDHVNEKIVIAFKPVTTAEVTTPQTPIPLNQISIYKSNDSFYQSYFGFNEVFDGIAFIHFKGQKNAALLLSYSYCYYHCSGMFTIYQMPLYNGEQYEQNFQPGHESATR